MIIPQVPCNICPIEVRVGFFSCKEVKGGKKEDTPTTTPNQKNNPLYFPSRAEEGHAQGHYPQPQCHSSRFPAWSPGSHENFI